MLSSCTARGRLVALACLGSLAMALAITAGPAHAQAAPAASELELDLPAQPLGQALNALARSAGVAIAAPAELVAGRAAAPLKGRYTLEQALGRALAGSGLEARYEGAVVVIRRAPPPPETRPAPADEAEQELPQVTVTGERTQRSLAQTSSSVAVLDARTLDQRPALDTANDVLDRIANVTSTGTQNLAPAVRGVDGTGPAQGADAFLAGTRPRLNIQIDGRPASYNEVTFGDVSIWDVEQVEVFRGPQSTVQGRNAIGGAVVIKTKDPTFEREAGLRAAFGNHKQRQGAFVVSGPILEDELAFRLAFERKTSESFVQFEPFPGVDDPRDFESTTLRGKLLIKPKALPDFSTLITLNHSEYESPQTEQVARPFDDHKPLAVGHNMPVFSPRTTSGIADTRWKLSDTYTFENKLSATDLRVTRKAPPGEGNAQIDGTELVLEPRLRFNAQDKRLDGFVGLYLFRAHQEEAIDLFGGTRFDDRTTTGAVFGEATLALRDDLHLTLGGRYEREQRRRTGGVAPFAIDLDETYTAFLPKLGLAWRVSEQTTLGTVIARGYNGGGAGFTYDTPFVSYTFEPEYVWNYEAYARSDLYGGKLRLTGNVFYSDYKDMQLPFDLNPDPGVWAYVVRNAERAVTYGAEFGARWLVRPGLQIFGDIGLLQTEVTRNPGSGIEGNKLPRAPALTADLGFTYRHASGIEFGADARYSEAYYSDITNVPRGKTDPYWLLNAKLAYTRGNVRTFAYVTNLLNSDTPIFIDVQPAGVPADDAAILPRPRTFGIGLEAWF